MMPINSLHALADIVGATTTINGVDDCPIFNVSLDSRKIEQQSLFVALKGQRIDAHDFIYQAVENGAVAVLVQRAVECSVPQLIVQDTQKALGKIAAWVRTQVPARIAALTGSSGKTSVKEITAKILSNCGQTLYTLGNLNNEIGVPMTLLRLTQEDDFAVIELGANHEGEIDYSSQLVQPHAVLVTNILAAHLEGFGSIEGVARAKGEIFDHLQPNGIAIINEENNAEIEWAHRLNGKRVWRFGLQRTDKTDFYSSDIRLTAKQTAFNLHTPVGSIDVNLQLFGKHNIANALAAAALAMAVGADLFAIKKGLLAVRPIKGRLYPIGINQHQVIIDDTYNANMGSMIAAADVLSMMPGYRIMVIGDMAELADTSAACHQQVGEAIKQRTIDAVLTVGADSQLAAIASGVGKHFPNKLAITTYLLDEIQRHSTLTILVKGSRSSAMEEIIDTLLQQV